MSMKPDGTPFDDIDGPEDEAWAKAVRRGDLPTLEEAIRDGYFPDIWANENVGPEMQRLGLRLAGKSGYEITKVEWPSDLKAVLGRIAARTNRFWVIRPGDGPGCYFAQSFTLRPDGERLIPGLPGIYTVAGESVQKSMLLPEAVLAKIHAANETALAGRRNENGVHTWPLSISELAEQYPTPMIICYAAAQKRPGDASTALTAEEWDAIRALRLMALPDMLCGPCQKGTWHHAHSPKMKRCIEALLAEGKSEGQAHAICYTVIGET